MQDDRNIIRMCGVNKLQFSSKLCLLFFDLLSIASVARQRFGGFPSQVFDEIVNFTTTLCKCSQTHSGLFTQLYFWNNSSFWLGPKNGSCSVKSLRAIICQPRKITHCTSSCHDPYAEINAVSFA